MFFIINGKKFNHEDINMAGVNVLGNIDGPVSYFLTIIEKDESSHDFFDFNTEEEAQKKLAKLYRFLKDQGAENFANLNNDIILNMDNVQSVDGYYNKLIGRYYVEATFKNNQEFELYGGFNGEYAHMLVDSYKDQEAQYCNGAEFN